MTGPVRRQDGERPDLIAALDDGSCPLCGPDCECIGSPYPAAAPSESEAVAVLRELVELEESAAEGQVFLSRLQRLVERARPLLSAAPETRTGPSEEAKPDMRPTGWWRVAYAEGHRNRPDLRCETPSEQVARRALKTCPGGGVLLRHYESPARNEWREVPSTTEEA